MKPNTALHLLRHASTLWNETGRIQGQTDTKLSPEGREQAAGWVECIRKLAPSRVLSSDLARAVETARILVSGLGNTAGHPLETDPRLREMDWGEWVGRTVSELAELEEFERQAARGWDFRPPDGESRKELLERSLGALRDAAAAYPGQTLLVVTHAGVIKALVYHLQNHDMIPGNPLPLEKRALHTIQWTVHGPDIRTLNKALP